jgi:protein phosphatase 1 regulatory subunit 7
MDRTRHYRISDPENIDRKLIDKKINEGELVIIQFSSEAYYYDEEVLKELNILCELYAEGLAIRFFGHYSEVFDCKWLLLVPNVRYLYIDCLTEAKNLSALEELPHLKGLSLGIFELKDQEILNSSSFSNLETLYLTETRTKALNLEYLVDLHKIKNLVIVGHKKNIETLSNLKTIETLRLHSMSKLDLSFVNNLDGLKSLAISLGGRPNINEIELNNIEELEITRVRGFCEFTNIQNFRKLKTLTIDQQIKLKSLEFETEMESLTDLKILNCKTFEKLKGMEFLPNLYQLRIYQTNISIDEFLKQQMPKDLEILAFYTTKAKEDEKIYQRLKSLGYKNGLEAT